MTLAVLFPGQGSQRPGLLAALGAAPSARPALAEASASLTRCGAPTLADLDTPERLATTVGAQLQLVVAGIAAADALRRAGVHPAVVAGHSVGAFAAAVTAGVLTVDEAVPVVLERARAMTRSAGDGRWGMLAVQGLTRGAVERLIADVATAQDPLWLAVVNARDQVVAAGSRPALSRLARAAEAGGARRAVALDVAVASHCPVQAAAAGAVADALAAVPHRRPAAAVVLGSGRRTTSAGAVLEDLAGAVARPVRWYDAVRLLPEIGVRRVVQVPPGRVLLDLLPPDLEVDAVALDPSTLERDAADLASAAPPS